VLGVSAPVGDELDVYVLGVFVPVAAFTGRCIAVVHRADEEDDMLVVVADGCEDTDDQIGALTEFQVRWDARGTSLAVPSIGRTVN